MYKEVEEIERKQAIERRKLNLFACEQFLKAFFEIYTPDHIKECKINDALENKTTTFAIQYEFDSKSIKDHEGFTIEKIDDKYVIKCSYQLRGIIEGYTIKKTKLYRKIKKNFNKREFKFIFNETDNPWHEFNRSGKYKGTIEIVFYEKYEEDIPKWIQRFF
ncbi:hypothetical protein WKH56_20545 [Priestia sp. SB1]|uniref:hypothetical protein n=1 Tax=Priestia sp. SB1 TaxID=3132359 RepID=UPI00317B5EA5